MKLAHHLPIKYGFDGGERPPPVPAQHQQDNGAFLPSFDNRLWLFHRKWEPPMGIAVKATLMILHGTVDHSGVYREIGNRLAGTGVAVFAMDQRGWGLSDGESMYLHDMDTFVADVDAFYRYIHESERYSNVKPRFLLGKSIGGTVSAFCVAKYQDYWTGLLGLSGAYELDPKIGNPSFIATTVLSILGYLSPKLPFKPLFDPKLLVKDAQALQAFQDDELCCKDNIRIGYILEFLYKTKELSQGVSQQLSLAMLMMYGEEDQVVTKSGHELMVATNQHADKSLKLYPEGLHNMLQEPSLKNQVMDDIEAWILSRAT